MADFPVHRPCRTEFLPFIPFRVIVFLPVFFPPLDNKSNTALFHTVDNAGVSLNLWSDWDNSESYKSKAQPRVNVQDLNPCCAPGGEDKMALAVVFLSLRRSAFVEHLSRVSWPSLGEISRSGLSSALTPSAHASLWGRCYWFFFCTIASSSLTHVTCFSGVISPLPVASLTSYI